MSLPAGEGKMAARSVVIFNWGLSRGALANNAAAMAHGFWAVGIRELYMVYLFSGPGSYVSLPEGVKLISLGVQHSRQAPIRLARFLRVVKPDVLISMVSVINIAAILGRFLAGRGHTKLVLSEHAIMSYEIYIEHKHMLRLRALPRLARILYPMADGLRANSQGVLDDLLTQIRVPMRHDRIVFIPNPVNIDAVSNHSREEPDHPWLRQKDKPVIVSVGRLAKQKNFALLLKAFGIVRRTMDARLVIVGEGPERKHLEGLIHELGSEDISLPGYSDNPWRTMARADVFVLPSEEEAFGLVLVEAMACGVPIIATDAMGGGPRSVLKNGQYGILVPSGDVEALADAILKILSSKDLHDHLTFAGQQRCQAFRPETIARQWFSFIERLS
jgi:glycosyltransferase involved in cell wall biosynthesis